MTPFSLCDFIRIMWHIRAALFSLPYYIEGDVSELDWFLVTRNGVMNP